MRGAKEHGSSQVDPEKESSMETTEKKRVFTDGALTAGRVIDTLMVSRVPEKMSTEERTARIAEIITRNTHDDRMREALEAIAHLWPYPPDAPDILSVSGINEGKS